MQRTATGFGQELFRSLYEELAELNEKIADADKRIQITFQKHPGLPTDRHCRRSGAFDRQDHRCRNQQRAGVRKWTPVLGRARVGPRHPTDLSPVHDREDLSYRFALIFVLKPDV